MKVRGGFVSNSSSSSYIIRIPKGRVLGLEEYRDWFDIKAKDDNPETLQKAIVAIWTVIYAYREKDRDSYVYFDHDILVDAEDILSYYQETAEGKDLEKISQMLYELRNPEKFPESEIIGFEADDNEGNLINYDITGILSNAGKEVEMKGDNVYAINEH